MKKKTYWLFASLILITMSACFITSCSDDDEKDDTYRYEGVVVSYFFDGKSVGNEYEYYKEHDTIQVRLTKVPEKSVLHQGSYILFDKHDLPARIFYPNVGFSFRIINYKPLQYDPIISYTALSLPCAFCKLAP